MSQPARPCAPPSGNVGTLPAQTMGPLTLRLIPTDHARFPFSLLHESLPPGEETPAVVHSRTWEILYVIKGRGWADLDGRQTPLKAGDWLAIPAGIVHRFVCGPEALEALSLFSPPLDAADPDVHTAEGLRPQAAERLLNAGPGAERLGHCY